MAVSIKLAYKDKDDLLQLFKEYTAGILAQGEEVAACLASQHYDDEINALEDKYGLPAGRLYLARVDGQAAGCIALRKMDDDYCEMKRLYVRSGHRGRQIGRQLVDRVISDAKGIGYKHMRLDTFPFMDAALGLYKQYGFYEIDRYYDNPAATAIFMQLDLL
ncbi:GNAT family N-acetyltransferase [Peptococcus simiae]|uniref:GNAT family N-acetyltransferase n=1 Tax=Peptococcus simiae TaxID=1643805 RepID=UPI00397EBAF3